MKKIVIFGAIAFLSLAAVVGCGNSGSANKKMEEREQALSESIRIKELAARVDRLDSTIAAYNSTVKEDLHMEFYVLDSCYLKMFHGDKFEEKYKEICGQVTEKEVAVNTFIRATMINLQE